MLKLYLEKVVDTTKKNQSDPTNMFKDFFDIIPTPSRDYLLSQMQQRVEPFDDASLKELKKSYYRNRTLQQVKSEFGTLIKNNTLRKLFDCEEGVGRGELLLAFLVKNINSVSGQNLTYDLLVGTKKYEVKVLDKYNLMRTAKMGKIENCIAHPRLLKTVGLLNRLFELEIPAVASILSPAVMANLLNANIVTEMGKDKYAQLQDVFQELHKIKRDDIKGYTKVVFQGPKEGKISVPIQPIDKEKIEGKDVIKLKKEKSDTQETDVWIILSRLEYVQNPEQLQKDLQGFVDQIVMNKTFILFDSKITKMIIAAPQTMKFANINQGYVRIQYKED